MTDVVLALAGRRIDSVDAKRAAFPLDAVPRVSMEIEAYLLRLAPVAMFSSAACGADIIALRAAKALGIHRTVILPYDRNLFRSTSVQDRPGQWQDYDEIIDEIMKEGGVSTLGFTEENPAAFQAVNNAILNSASASGYPTRACIIWEGAGQPSRDYTEEFRSLALERCIEVDEILTI